MLEATARARWIGPRGRMALAAALALGAAAWIAVAPATKQPFTVDEGQHAIGARHILLDTKYLERQQRYVGGHEDWEHEARTYWSYPPAVDAIYAVSIGTFGMTPLAHGLPLLLCLLIAAGALLSIARDLYDRDTALVAVTLFVWSQAAFGRGTMMEAEPFVTAFTTASIACGVRGTMRRSAGWWIAAGALAGAAFLMKLWLAWNAVLPLIGLLALVHGRAYGARSTLLRAAACAATFVAVASAHLLFVAIAAPRDVGLWWIAYLGPLTRVAPHASQQPIWFYAASFYRELAPLALPLVIFAVTLWRGARSEIDRERATAARVLASCALLSIAILTASDRKESLYAYPVAPLAMLFAAAGIAALVRGEWLESERARRTASAAVGALMLVATALVLVVWRAHALPTVATSDLALVHTIVIGGAGAAILLFGAARPRGALLGALVIALATVWGASEGRAVLARNLDDPTAPVARYFAPDEVRAAPPAMGARRDVFVSTYWLPVGYRTWTRGRSWYSESGEEVRLSDPSLRWFQIDKRFEPKVGALPDATEHARVLARLRREMRDVTSAIERREGHRIPTYVFVRREETASRAGSAHP